MKTTRTLSSYVLLVGVMGLSIVGGVVAYQVYSASVKNQTTAEQSTAIKPLDGVINQSTIDNLSKRTVYTDVQMGLLLNATPTPQPTATQSGGQAEAAESSVVGAESTNSAITQ